MRQFVLKSWRLQDSNLSEIALHQTDLIKKMEKKNHQLTENRRLL